MINPHDVRKHEFTRAWRGYDRDEVHALLDALAREFEELVRRNRALADRVRQADEQEGRYRETEKSLQDAAVTVQQALENRRRAVEEEAGALIHDAHRRAEEEERAALGRITSLRAELQALDDERARFYLRFQDFLRDQAERLELLMNPGDPPPGGARGA